MAHVTKKNRPDGSLFVSICDENIRMSDFNFTDINKC